MNRSQKIYNFSFIVLLRKSAFRINFGPREVLKLKITRNEAKACNTVGGPSFRGSLDKSRMVSRTKNIKMFHQYLSENTLANTFW